MANATHIRPKTWAGTSLLFGALVDSGISDTPTPKATDEIYLSSAEGEFAAEPALMSASEEMSSRVRAIRVGWGGPWGGPWSPDARRVTAAAITNEED
jgi:hypothetical protein